MRIWLVSAGFCALALAGCGGPDFVGRPNLSLVDGGALPPPERADLAVPGRDYVIGPGDRLAVEVFGISELSRSVLVDANGQIALPVAGVVTASGTTPVELGTEIATRLSARHVRDPQVTVSIAEVHSAHVTIDGAVTEPGVYPYTGRLTLVRALARAKGVTEFARQNHVVVFRTVGNQNLAALYDLRAIRRGMYEDPEIYANDVVVVGESQARRLFRDAIQGAGILTAPLVALLQR
jgi:polysaccharide biosynthesis/export protein